MAHWGAVAPSPSPPKTNKNFVGVDVLSKRVPENMIVYFELGKEWPFIQYEDGDYHNGDGKLDGDNDKIICTVCLVKC